MELVKCGDKLYNTVASGPWYGFEPFKVNEYKIINHRWVGKKIPIDELWSQIISFFQWSFKETKSETVVHLYYHEEEGWKGLVLPQRGYTNLSVKTLPDHPNLNETMQRLGTNWGVLSKDGTHITGTPMGSVHHHCDISAFQSHTDTSDEKEQEGIHITIGDLSKKSYSIHSRINFRKTFTEAFLPDWFKLDSQTAHLVPEFLHEKIIGYRLTQPVEENIFPEWWKENVLKEESRPKPTSTYITKSWDDSPIIKKTSGHNYWFSKELEACLSEDFDLEDALDMLVNLDNHSNKVMISLLADNNCSLEEAITIVKAMIEDDELEELYSDLGKQDQANMNYYP